ncbi:hypothetical protein [Sphingobacterium griseoflavum]|uniref:Uncharacterized protein n=1 Tax=Sphingobacterium griseoflavum TaxID=1474952 RepID=A0ABQ3HSE7_9SPHI|nr:hypothetical protein [Sphingobacterium griseoflavum]GHE23144.1 hypothetical protein GCM10017764_01120 [Sphingobacterium griseoflavum]
MSWYRTYKLICRAAAASAIAALLFSCSSTPPPAGAAKEKQFDIPHFFKEEIARLDKEDPLITKTVEKDSLSETKALKISDWNNELASFSSIDLNKPVYAGVLKKDSTAGKVVFTANDPKVELSSVEIRYDKDNVPNGFVIRRTVKNSLYQTTETLNYQRDSAYSLEKEQSVLLLGDRHYTIRASFHH